MKTKLIIMSLILSASSVLYAGSCEHNKGEGHRGEGNQGEQFRERRMNDLNLSEAQQKSFEIIMNNQRESMKAAMDVIHTDTKTELSKVLSAEQMQLLEEKKQHRTSKAQKRMRKRMAHRENKQQK